MRDLLNKARQVAEAEIFSVSSQSTTASFEANRLKGVQTRASQGIALRLIKDGRIGFASTNKRDEVDKLVAMALETASFGAVARFAFPPSYSYPPVQVYDAAVGKIAIEQMVRLGEELIDRVRAIQPDIVCEATVSASFGDVAIMNSNAGEANYQKSVFSLSLDGVLIRDTDMFFVWESEISSHPISDPGMVADTVIEQLRRGKRIAPSASGRLPVIFTPEGVASALIAPLTMAFNGKLVLEGASPLGHREGETVFDPRFSMWDDPTLDFRPGSRCCDDEGVPSRRIPLVQDGMVMGFLYDLQTAALAKRESTGSASRAMGGQPRPSVSNLVISEGDISFNDMVKNIKEGLVVEMLMGASQTNLLSGDFSGNVLLGYKIENGEIVGRVKDTMVSGNVYQMLKAITAIGRESRWIGGTLRTPPLYFDDVAVAARK